MLEQICAHAPLEFTFRHGGSPVGAALPPSETGVECEPCSDHSKQDQQHEQPRNEPWETLRSLMRR